MTVAINTRTAARLATWLQARAELGIGNGHLFCTISNGKWGGPKELKHHGGERVTVFNADKLQPGRPLTPGYVNQVVTRTAERAGIERRVTPHTLRHSFATHLLRKTGNLELTRKALRHSRITTTATIYSHLANRDVEDAVRALREEPEPEPDPQVQAAAAALAGLTEKQRAALQALLQGAGA